MQRWNLRGRVGGGEGGGLARTSPPSPPAAGQPGPYTQEVNLAITVYFAQLFAGVNISHKKVQFLPSFWEIVFFLLNKTEEERNLNYNLIGTGNEFKIKVVYFVYIV